MNLTDVIPDDMISRVGKILLGVLVLYLVLWLSGFQKLFANDTDGIGALLQIMGTLYSVLYAFATYVIWGQFTAVEREILKEAGALKDILIFSTRLKVATRDPIVRAVKNYAKAVVDTEWLALSRNERTERTDKLFYDLVTCVSEMKPEDDTERALYSQLLVMTDEASSHRDERISMSRTRIPRTLLAFVSLTAGMILFLLFLYLFRNPVLGLVAVLATSIVLFFAYFVVTDLDNPFEGTWNVKPDAFGELITKYR